ncbi:UNVERIFIED_CONTAM: hypothetical protein Sradi_0670500 [Sesamum radiatum]|uniref:Uncharacterized protein n=1 Tax=Sesamum radiatum TaxID=300843 RepID=A0AAW2VNW7_SESRA
MMIRQTMRAQLMIAIPPSGLRTLWTAHKGTDLDEQIHKDFNFSKFLELATRVIDEGDDAAMNALRDLTRDGGISSATPSCHQDCTFSLLDN